MDAFFETIREWQEIAGAILGGLFALWVALIVANDARSRVEKSAAMVVVGVLLSFRAAYASVRDRVAYNKNDQEARDLEFAIVVATMPPAMPDRFHDAVAALLPLNIELAAHLTHIELFHTQMAPALSRLQQDNEVASRNAKADLPRPKSDMLADARILKRSLENIFNSSACAVILLNKLVLSRLHTWNRIRYKFWPNEVERRCSIALKEGRFSQPMPDD